MIPPKTKAQIRAELDEQINAYLEHGGGIKSVPRGLSGNQSNLNLFTHAAGDGSPKQERTPLNHVVQELENRKHCNKKTSTHTHTQSRRKKVLITDDFGEPVRWVWVDGDSTRP